MYTVYGSRIRVKKIVKLLKIIFTDNYTNNFEFNPNYFDLS